jgi:GNAT superfamily N-acetyltransferase
MARRYNERAMLRIRTATAADVEAILALIRQLAAYEREPDAVKATEADLLRDGFAEAPRFHVLLAEDEVDGQAGAVGFALYFFTYSTWRGRSSLHLEDLFVTPEARGRGVGRALMASLAARAQEDDCPRFEWQVLDWNAPAIGFYERLGAEVRRPWLSVRLEGPALAALANEAPPRELC